MRPFGLTDYERLIILRALKNNKGNITKTAKALKVSIRTLRYRVTEYLSAGYDVTLNTESGGQIKQRKLHERKREA